MNRTTDRIMIPARPGPGRRVLTTAAQAFIVFTWLLAGCLTGRLFVVAFVK